MSDDLSRFSMFELFADEAKTHASALSAGLLTLEENPNEVAHVDGLMRAAHSIKGAARIVGLDAVVGLAHAMEDCFVTVGKGKEQLTSARVDQLLEGVDFIQQVGGLPEGDLPAWLDEHATGVDGLVSRLRLPTAEDPVRDEVMPAPTRNAPDPTPSDIAAGDPVDPGREETAEEAETTATTPAKPEPPAPPQGDAEPSRRTVSVNSDNLNRIMQLAGESIIESGRMQSVADALAGIRQAQREMTDMLAQIESPDRDRSAKRADLESLRDLCDTCEQRVTDHGVALERSAWRIQQLASALHHESVASHMRPFEEGTTAFPRMIRDLARSLGKRITLRVVGGSVPVDRDILSRLEAPLNHLLRNCVDHGIELPDARRAAGKPETGQIVLTARHHAGMLTIEIQDDGHGIDPEALKAKVVERQLVDASMADRLGEDELFEFLFLPGFSTAGQVTEISGRGVGLDVVRSMVQDVSGSVRAESQLGRSMTFTLHLPVSLSVIRAALVEIDGEPYAFPLSHLVRVLHVPRSDVKPIQGRQQFLLDGHSVGLIRATELWGSTAPLPNEDRIAVLVIGEDHRWCGLVVDRFIGEQDVVVRPLDPRLGKVPHIASAAVLEEGQPLLIVNVEDMAQSVRHLLGEGRLRGMTSIGGGAARARRRVLVVDDSITVREVERQLLMSHGYDVDVAVDGQDGWKRLSAGSYDLLITDVDMPRMTGIELIRVVREDDRFAELPIVIVSYKEREEDRMRGLEVGANAYLTKGSFHDDSLLTTVADLIGQEDGTS